MPKIASAKQTVSNLAVPVPSQQYVSVREAARLLKVSEISIRRFLTQKKLRRFKVGRRTLLLHSEVVGLIHEA
jgi:excisionase family DNA binding protein